MHNLTFVIKSINADLIYNGSIIKSMSVDKMDYLVSIVIECDFSLKYPSLGIQTECLTGDCRVDAFILSCCTGFNHFPDINISPVRYSGPMTKSFMSVVQTIHVNGIIEYRKT